MTTTQKYVLAGLVVLATVVILSIVNPRVAIVVGKEHVQGFKGKSGNATIYVFPRRQFTVVNVYGVRDIRVFGMEFDTVRVLQFITLEYPLGWYY